MKSTIKIVAFAAAVAGALIQNAEASSPDAQAQAGALLIGGSQVNSSRAQEYIGSTISSGYAVTLDAQSQARATLSYGQRTTLAHDSETATTAPPVGPNTQLANRTAPKSLDAQTRAATVLLGSGA
jgi:hypothetical protein